MGRPLCGRKLTPGPTGIKGIHPWRSRPLVAFQPHPTLHARGQDELSK